MRYFKPNIIINTCIQYKSNNPLLMRKVLLQHFPVDSLKNSWDIHYNILRKTF